MRFHILLLTSLAAPAAAQIASDDFENGNPNGWGVEFLLPGMPQATGGNPGGRLEINIQDSMSTLPAAMIVPATTGHPYAGDFRALGASAFTFDRQVESGAANFGTQPFLVLGSDNGTPTDFLDDDWAFVWTGDSFQFGMVPWATISTPIPASETTLPANWDIAALPNSPLAAAPADQVWNSVIMNVDYVGIAMSRPFNGGAWFGSHVLSLDNFVLEGAGTLGLNYCSPANVNASGQPGVIGATGSASTLVNAVTLNATQVTANAFGFFITSTTQGFVANPNGSAGNLCVVGSIGRYVGAGQIQNSGPSGAFSLLLDLTQTPQPTGLVTVTPGQTWNFQAWFRDVVGGTAVSNFTDAVSIQFS